MWLKWKQRDGCVWSRQSHLKIFYIASRRRPVVDLRVSGTSEKREKNSCWWLYIQGKTTRWKMTHKLLVRTWWLWAEHSCFVSAGLRCRRLLSGRHERTTAAVPEYLCCSVQGRLQGRSAVLAVRRYYCGYRGLVCAFT